MAQPESRLSRKIMKSLNLEGVFCFKVHGGPQMMSGLPDIVACVDGMFLGLEVKMPTRRGKLRDSQRLVMPMIERAGGTVAVVTSSDEALAIVEQMRDEQRP